VGQRTNPGVSWRSKCEKDGGELEEAGFSEVHEKHNKRGRIQVRNKDDQTASHFPDAGAVQSTLQKVEQWSQHE
jgi:hypothetical protein